MANPHVSNIEHIATFARRKGIIFPSAEIYGGLAGFFDYGPIGVEIKNNIKDSWWRYFVRNRSDVVGIDGTNITSSKVWEASGHLKSFADIMVEDTKTKNKYRADQIVEDALKQPMDGKTAEELNALIKEHNILSPEGNPLAPSTTFNLMFPVQVGAGKGTTAYLRGETAQVIFTNFRNITQTSRVQLPFGIAQIGKSFRNEISPRDFLFRVREFEQMELEYFFDKDAQFTLFTQEHAQEKIVAFTEEDQTKQTQPTIKSFGELVESKRLNAIHAHFLVESLRWFESIGISRENMRLREHTQKELSHYSSATYDIEYDYPQMGFKELFGCADRGQYDLKQHQEHSKVSMEMHDEATGKKILPSVIEPSFGVDRALLAILIEAYREDKERNQTILSLNPRIAPTQVAVFPLVKKLAAEAQSIIDQLKEDFVVFYDASGSVGRRYARQDEVGTPYCITFDFDSLEDKKVTLRDRDTTVQIRVPITELHSILTKAMKGEKFNTLGEQ